MPHEQVEPGVPAGGWVARVQVTFDSTAPHDLAQWWAEALGWHVEEQDETLIRSMIDQGVCVEGVDTLIWQGRLVWALGLAVVPPAEAPPGLPRLLFQAVPEERSVKNRVHLDVRVTAPSPLDPSAPTADLEAAVARWVSLGAVRLYDGRRGPHPWVTLADPQGNEVCLT